MTVNLVWCQNYSNEKKLNLKQNSLGIHITTLLVSYERWTQLRPQNLRGGKQHQQDWKFRVYRG